MSCDINSRRRRATKRKILVIGLDGATFDVIQPLIKKGMLPTLKKLIETGTYGELKSSIPPVTVPAWKCYSTGKNPGKLGVTTHKIVDVTRREVEPVNSTSFYGQEIWEIIGQFDLKSIVANMPLTYPIKKINGIFIAGINTPTSSPFAYPIEIMKEISETVEEYNPWNDLRKIFLSKEPVKKLKKIIRNRFSVMEYLCKNKEWDFFHGAIFLSDVVQHYYWTNMNVISEIWTTIDQGIERLLQSVPNINNTDVFIFSDHGFGKAECIFYIDRWLIEKGYLKNKNLLQGFFGCAKAKIDSLIYSMIKSIFPVRAEFDDKRFHIIFEKMLSLSRVLFGRMLSTPWDWKKSKVVVLTDSISAHIYINRNLINKISEFENLKREIKTKLKTEKNIPLMVFDKSEVYHGTKLERCPDLIVVPKNLECLIRDSAIDTEGIFCRKQGKFLGWIGNHRLNGIFIACGKDIKENTLVQKLKILDLAPTFLHILGIPIPSDMDGQVLKSIFTPHSGLFQKEIKYAETNVKKRAEDYKYNELEKKEIKEKLRQLGYF